MGRQEPAVVDRPVEQVVLLVVMGHQADALACRERLVHPSSVVATGPDPIGAPDGLILLLENPVRSVDDLARIEAPALLTKGTRSDPIDRHRVDVLGERLPNAHARESEGDHAHHIEQLDAFLDALETHLAGA